MMITEHDDERPPLTPSFMVLDESGRSERTLPGVGASVLCAHVLSPSGRFVASGHQGSNRTIVVNDLRTGEDVRELSEFPNATRVLRAAANRDADQLLVETLEQAYIVEWDVTTGNTRTVAPFEDGGVPEAHDMVDNLAWGWGR